jgi:drug/metabolite transporter (DMT)-like permease
LDVDFRPIANPFYSVPLASAAPIVPAYAAWLAVCLIWGTTYLAIRIALETIPPFLMTSFRWLIAGTILVTLLRWRRERLPEVRAWPSQALVGLLLIGFGNGAVVWAEQTVASGLTAVLVATVPFWMVGVERATGKHESLGGLQLAGLCIGFLGIVLLVWPELRVEGGTGFLGGFIATQIACLGWSIGSSYSRRQRDGNVLAAVSLQMLFAGVGLLALGSAIGEWDSLVFTTRTAAALAYLVVFGSIVGFSAYAYALKHLPVATVSLYAYVNPVIAVLLGTAILDEPLTPRIVIAGMVVLAGMALVRMGE